MHGTPHAGTFCKCPEGLVPDPTPQLQCSKPDPCEPSPCGPGTTCTPNRDGNPICRCLPGLVPKPDTITGEGCRHSHSYPFSELVRAF